MNFRWLFAPMLILFVSGSTAFGAGSSSSGAVRADNLAKASLVLDWNVNSDHGGIFTAIRRGIFGRHHIQMSAYVPSDTSAQIRLVAAGRADFGVSYETDLIDARAHNIPVRSVMCIMQHPLNTIMALRSSRISRPRQLVGKTVGMAGSPSDVPILRAVMARDHASMRKVRTVTVGYSLLTALLARKVDAVVGVYWTWEAIQARMKGYQVGVMRVERWGVPNYCEMVLVTADKTIRTRADFVRRTVQSIQEGYAYAENHPSAAWKALYHQDKTLQSSLVLRSLNLLRPVITDAPTIGYQNPNQWRRYERWLAVNKLISKRVDVAKTFTNQFLKGGVR